MVAFASWFSSEKGVVQTFVVIFAWVIIEQIFPHLDPSGFILMYVLTVWSGVTQNVLGYASNISAEEAKKSQVLLVQLVKNNIEMMEAMSHIMTHLHELISEMKAIGDKDTKIIEELASEVDILLESRLG